MTVAELVVIHCGNSYCSRLKEKPEQPQVVGKAERPFRVELKCPRCKQVLLYTG